MTKKIFSLVVILLSVFNVCHGFSNVKELLEREIIDTAVYDKIRGKKFLFYNSSHPFMSWSLIVPEGDGYIVFSSPRPTDDEGTMEMNEGSSSILTDTITGKCPLIQWGFDNWEYKNKELEGRLSLSGEDVMGDISLYSQSGDRIIKYGNSTIVYRRDTALSVLADLRYLMGWYAAFEELRQIWRTPLCEVYVD